MKLITKPQRTKLLKNWGQEGENLTPVLKIFSPVGAATWLIYSMDPEENDRLYGLCDPGLESPEIGYVLLSDLESQTIFGQGVLEIQTYETANLQIVNPQLLPEPDAGLFASADWDVLMPSAARRQIDDAVYDALGLTAGERDAVYAGVTELVVNRKRRARSI